MCRWFDSSSGHIFLSKKIWPEKKAKVLAFLGIEAKGYARSRLLGRDERFARSPERIPVPLVQKNLARKKAKVLAFLGIEAAKLKTRLA